ncbi:MAG: iron uptake porin, partial [Calothrix sp. SM1_7_51]|nr:iron uptake porin [Calothrix sp. SM1_7_51]
MRGKNKLWKFSWLLALSVFGVPQNAVAQVYQDTLAVEPEKSVETEEQINKQAKEQVFNLSSSESSANSTEDSMSQVTSVSQLRDVQPTDWAFQALQSLVERYGCISGYPDATFRGNRSISRYEFAAGVNACLDRVSQLISEQTANLANRQDLEAITKLQSEFAAELATLRGRVDSLEPRTAELEANQFSTTTKLTGINIVGIQGRTNNRGDVNPRDGVKDTQDPGTNVNLINLTQLYLTTQFNSRSFLVTGLGATNGETRPRLSDDTQLAYELSTRNQVVLTDARFHWLPTDNLALMVGTTGVTMTNAFRGPNRAENAATGALSGFAQRNPILNIGFL